MEHLYDLLFEVSNEARHQILILLSSVSLNRARLDQAAAQLPDGSYEPKVAPVVTDVGLGLAALRRMRYETGLNSLRSVWV